MFTRYITYSLTNCKQFRSTKLGHEEHIEGMVLVLFNKAK